MSVFADSSALVKLYSDEAGSDDVRSLASPLVVSRLARVEVPAAIWRKRRIDELSDGDARLLVGDFEADWFGTADEAPRFFVVPPVPDVLESAARLVAVHGLKAFDGVQLASALAARQADRGCDTLAAFDADLRASAAREGLLLAPA